MKENKLSSNYDAIRNMSLDEMAVFLDYVYTTGLNNGLYAAQSQDNDEHDSLLDSTPYDKEWLSDNAEEATEKVFDDNGDAFLPNAFVKATFRCAGIDINTISEE